MGTWRPTVAVPLRDGLVSLVRPSEVVLTSTLPLPVSLPEARAPLWPLGAVASTTKAVPVLLVLLPAVGWMYWSGDTGWATALLVWSLIVGTLDNFLRPMLIKRGADLPLLLIFAGVIGGMLGFGLIGLFVGPVALAVTYTLMLAWIEDALGKDEAAESSGSAG